MREVAKKLWSYIFAIVTVFKGNEIQKLFKYLTNLDIGYYVILTHFLDSDPFKRLTGFCDDRKCVIRLLLLISILVINATDV